jgi:uncharacterized iron-regulated membrane protein
MRLPARLWFRRLHLWLGLGLGAVLVAVAGSGAALVFRDEIRALDPLVRAPAAQWDGVTDIGFSAARDLARAKRPGHELQILWFPNRLRPYYEAAFSKEGKRFTGNLRFHPATGVELLIPRSPVLTWLEGFHVNLHLGEGGAFLVRWCTVLFSLVLLSGLYLWWPGWKPHLWLVIRGGRLRLWDAHRVMGLAAALPLLVMLTTGLIMAFPAAQSAVFMLTGSTPPESAKQNLGELKSTVPTGVVRPEPSDENLLAAARAASPSDAFIFYITFPISPTESRQVRLQRGYSPAPFGEIHRVYFDRYTGNIIGHLRPDTGAASQYLARFNNELHYGTIGGLVTKAIWIVACSLVAFFAVTGVMLWRRRNPEHRGAGAAHALPSRASTIIRLKRDRVWSDSDL